MPKSASRLDLLHDKYHQILTTKAGTRYERLAAMVFKALENQNTVIHDLKLTGDDPEVKHQIDVLVEIGGNLRRVLVECKDFDISGEKVGLDIIRNFRSVIEDTGVDEGIVITCQGFTQDAQKYARSKDIKLAVLRPFETKDSEGRITKIALNIVVQEAVNPRATVAVSEAEHPRYMAALAEAGVNDGIRDTDPVFMVRNSERHQFNAFVTERMNAAICKDGPRADKIAILADGWMIEIGSNAPIRFDGIIIDFDVDEERHTREITSRRVAELILSGFGDADLIIFGDQIERHSIEPNTGAVS